ncbi:metal ABC transporter solute-binding protein, Zn/Mn family [Rhodococcus indonesiensis]|uniref:metal ABC transporter solute-binding protein, Zn/Mn family n=1 Tax=Rhodococcus indonesiensis TaxID=3055869 RepID=UPI0039F6F3A6
MRLPRRMRAATATVGLTCAAALTLAACGSDSGDGATGSGEIRVVASTNVWGSVAQAVAGDRIEVQSLITEPSADPHSYEASPADAAAISDASLVVYNGGGYDQFVDDILDSTGAGAATVDAMALFESGTGSDLDDGHDHSAGSAPEDETHASEEHEGETHAAEEGDAHAGHDHSGVNEHVWYDLAAADAVAHAVAERLAELDPAGADTYRANADAFHSQLHEVTDVTAAIAAAHANTPVAQTESIGHYLVTSAKLEDRTPADFTNAIENGTDPSPAAIAATRQLLLDKQVDVLIHNPQTEDKVSRDMRATADSAGIPVVEVTETLPEGVDYIQWQKQTAEALSAALDAAR